MSTHRERRAEVRQPEPDSKCGLRGERNDTLGWLSTQNAERITPQRACRAVCSKQVWSVEIDRVLCILVVIRGARIVCAELLWQRCGRSCTLPDGDATRAGVRRAPTDYPPSHMSNLLFVISVV